MTDNSDDCMNVVETTKLRVAHADVILPELRKKVQSNPGWGQKLWEYFLPPSCMERCSASASSLSANSSGRVSSRPSAPYASRAHSGSSASDRKRVSVPVVPISSIFFFRSIVHCREHKWDKFNGSTGLDISCKFKKKQQQQQPCNHNLCRWHGASWFSPGASSACPSRGACPSAGPPRWRKNKVESLPLSGPELQERNKKGTDSTAMEGHEHVNKFKSSQAKPVLCNQLLHL